VDVNLVGFKMGLTKLSLGKWFAILSLVYVEIIEGFQESFFDQVSFEFEFNNGGYGKAFLDYIIYSPSLT
jgi:hypothetical protein